MQHASDQYSNILSPFDQVMPRNYIRTALVFATDHHQLALSRLQAGLERTCNQLPWLKGRITERLDKRKQLVVHWSPASACPVIEQRAAPDGYPSYAELVSSGAPAERFAYALFNCLGNVGSAGEEGVPVLGVTGLPIEGGLVLGVSVNHAVVDGTGYGALVRAWSENTRERGSAVLVVGLDAEEPLRREARIAAGLGSLATGLGDGVNDLESLLARHREYRLGGYTLRPDPSAPPGISKVFTISVAKLRAVREMLMRASGLIDASMLTVNNILSALLWSHVTHIRTTRPEKPLKVSISRLGFAVNGRRILSLNEPPYLGNFTLLAQTSIEVPVLQQITSTTDEQDGLAHAISTIATSTAAVDLQHISSLMQLADLLPDFSDLAPGWDFLNGPDFSITSWAYMGLYECDFGEEVGRPQVVRVPCMPIDGVAIILPKRMEGPDEERLEVTLMLREDDMERLSASSAWRSWLVEERT